MSTLMHFGKQMQKYFLSKLFSFVSGHSYKTVEFHFYNHLNYHKKMFKKVALFLYIYQEEVSGELRIRLWGEFNQINLV